VRLLPNAINLHLLLFLTFSPSQLPTLLSSQLLSFSFPLPHSEFRLQILPTFYLSDFASSELVEGRIFSRGIVLPYRTTTGPTSDFFSLTASAFLFKTARPLLKRSAPPRKGQRDFTSDFRKIRCSTSAALLYPSHLLSSPPLTFSLSPLTFNPFFFSYLPNISTSHLLNFYPFPSQFFSIPTSDFFPFPTFSPSHLLSFSPSFFPTFPTSHLPTFLLSHFRIPTSHFI
jgi:hypothetical protein